MTDRLNIPVVMKLGGSLLDLPDISRRLQLVACCFPEPVKLVVGGGAAADQVRTYDANRGLSAELVHDLAVEAMSRNARALRLLSAEPRDHLHRAASPLQSETPHSFEIIDVRAVLADLENSHGRLPRTWDVTSDSIAAWIAVHWKASLVLLKSINCPDSVLRLTESAAPRSVIAEALIRSQLVDRAFISYGARLDHLSWSNLRATEWSVQQLW